MFRYTFFILIFLYSCSCSYAQTKKQLKEAVLKAEKYNTAVELTIYCKNLKLFIKKKKRVLRKLDSFKLEYEIKIMYIKDRNSYFYIK
jgi:hypothetical protein